MKKRILTTLVLLCMVTTHAQLKVMADGKVGISTNSASSKLSIGGTGSSTYDLYVDGKAKIANELHANVISFTDPLQGIAHNIVYNPEVLRSINRVNTFIFSVSSFPHPLLDVSDEINIESEQANDSIDDQTRLETIRLAISSSDLNNAFPGLAFGTTLSDRYEIDQTQLIALLFMAVKELSQKVDSLEDTRINPQQRSSMIRESANSPSAILKPTYVGATLYQNTPNPFTERTEIRFSLPDDMQNANICIFDMSGKMLKQIPVTSSMQSITINGYELAAGMYLYSLVVGGQEVDTKRMILSK